MAIWLLFRAVYKVLYAYCHTQSVPGALTIKFHLQTQQDQCIAWWIKNNFSMNSYIIMQCILSNHDSNKFSSFWNAHLKQKPENIIFNFSREEKSSDCSTARNLSNSVGYFFLFEKNFQYTTPPRIPNSVMMMMTIISFVVSTL